MNRKEQIKIRHFYFSNPVSDQAPDGWEIEQSYYVSENYGLMVDSTESTWLEMMFLADVTDVYIRVDTDGYVHIGVPQYSNSITRENERRPDIVYRMIKLKVV